MTAFVTAGAGFLAAVLWFDLMFDVQVSKRDAEHRGLKSISDYYGRVTTGARPMNLLVGAVMAATLVAIALQIADGADPAWVGWASLVLVGSAIALAAVHTYPAAVRLGAGTDPLDAQLRIARSICRDHVFCLAAIAAVLAIQLGFAG